ncbi:MAG: M50 family metallopeptidase [bacterium]|nr:M50 family metallopeptidase [bacterium]
MVTFIIFLLILGILIFVHEFGHFTLAKRLGVKVDEFAFGFKPRLWGIKKGETTYAINAIPLGGYVSMYGEEKDRGSRSFMGKPRWARAIILFSGVMMNFVFAWLIFTAIFIAGFEPLVPGMVQGRGVKVVEPVVINGVEEDSPAYKAGLQTNDRIVSVDGQPVGSSLEVIANIYEKNGRLATIVVRRDGKEMSLNITPRKNPPPDTGPLGIELSGGKIGTVWYKAPFVALDQVGRLSELTVGAFGNFVKNLFVKHEVSKDVSGMVGVGFATDVVRRLGFTYVLQFIALISLSLAVMNLLPIVPLDGGHLLVLGIEAVRRKKLTENQLQWMGMAGLAFIMLLVVITTYSDILRFSVWDRIVSLFR